MKKLKLLKNIIVYGTVTVAVIGFIVGQMNNSDTVSKSGQLKDFDTSATVEQLKSFDIISTKIYQNFQLRKDEYLPICKEDSREWKSEYYDKLNNDNKIQAKKTIAQYSARFKGKDEDTNIMILCIVIDTLDRVATKHSLRSVGLEESK